MRLGLLADIHGDVTNLSRAIERLQEKSVDQILVLGDIIYDTRGADETVSLLRSCGAQGVWGNHELGLCVDPDRDVLDGYSDAVVQFFGTLQPRVEVGDVMVSHTFPTQDARDVLSYYVGQPGEDDLVAQCFDAMPHRIMICGHFHRWFAATPSGDMNWSGERPLRLDRGQRYFVVIDAVMHRCAAILDQESSELIPLRL